MLITNHTPPLPSVPRQNNFSKFISISKFYGESTDICPNRIDIDCRIAKIRHIDLTLISDWTSILRPNYLSIRRKISISKLILTRQFWLGCVNYYETGQSKVQGRSSGAAGDNIQVRFRVECPCFIASELVSALTPVGPVCVQRSEAKRSSQLPSVAERC